MKKISLLLFLMLLLLIRTPAQDIFPSAYEIKTDDILLDTLSTRYWQMLEDKGGKLSFDEVSKSVMAGNFHFDTAKKINFQITTYWFRFALKNTSGHELKIGLYEFLKAKSDWYIIRSTGQTTHKQTGLEIPWSKNESLKFITYFPTSFNFLPLSIQPQETLVLYNRVVYNYLNYTNIDPKQFSITYGSTEKVIIQNYVDNESHYFTSISDAFFLGIALLAAFFSFFYFLTVKERTYLYFSLYVLFLGFGRFMIEAELYHEFLREYPKVFLFIMHVIWPFSFAFLTYFICSLLKTKKYHPRWHRFIVFFILLEVIVGVSVDFIAYYLRGTRLWGMPNSISTATYAIVQFNFIITLALFLKQELDFDRRVLVAIFPSFVIWVVGAQLFDHFSVETVRSGFGQWVVGNWHFIENICIIWQVFCFSWLLFHRFTDLKHKVVQKELEKEMERSQIMVEQKIVLEEQVTKRTSELKKSFENLKSTQSQLIQSEKMASLGELTAGIAHEIQNPLNFVNNFSEVNTELIDEAGEEMDKGNISEAKIILKDIKENEQKINHHGKRADAIVKGMLQHSSSGSGKKEPTDINKLADEYFRLAYHGLRAKDKTFNATMKTDYDQTIGNINIIPQDIGKVILNLINNAFYAVNEKKNAESLKPKADGKTYEPTVAVSTKKVDDKVFVSVKDNGNGISQKIVDKIFQPFFTTKPTGQGTGLGLSLSYDIIKAYGGEIKVESKEGEGSEFIVQLSVI